MIDVENPYDQACEFKISILESNNRYGVIKNPYNKHQLDESAMAASPSLDSLKQQSKSSVESYKQTKSPKNKIP